VHRFAYPRAFTLYYVFDQDIGKEGCYYDSKDKIERKVFVTFLLPDRVDNTYCNPKIYPSVME